MASDLTVQCTTCMAKRAMGPGITDLCSPDFPEWKKDSGPCPPTFSTALKGASMSCEQPGWVGRLSLEIHITSCNPLRGAERYGHSDSSLCPWGRRARA